MPNELPNETLNRVANEIQNEMPNEISNGAQNETSEVPNKRKTIWNSRELIDAVSDDAPMQTYQKLKKTDWFDTITWEDAEWYYNTFFEMRKNDDEMIRSLVWEINSVYEIWCWSGATLFLYKNKYPNLKTGWIDYSQTLSDIAKKVLWSGVEIVCDEAANLDTQKKADLVYSDSVFVYFNNIEYAKNVLEKMCQKANKAILITEVYDKDKEQECLDYRRSQIENYDEKYKWLGKLFFEKKFFEDFAKEHGLKIKFLDVNNKYYWNSKYMFSVLLTK